MNYYCGLCNKPLTRSGEKHECRSFSEMFWSQPELPLEETEEDDWEDGEDASGN